MSASIVFDKLYERQALRDVLHVASHLFLNDIDKRVYNRLLSMLIGPLRIERRYFKVMKYRSIKIIILRSMSLVELIKNEILLVSLNAINDVKNRCFRAVFMIILKDLISFRRKIGVQSRRRAIEQKSYQSLMTRYKST